MRKFRNGFTFTFTFTFTCSVGLVWLGRLWRMGLLCREVPRDGRLKSLIPAIPVLVLE